MAENQEQVKPKEREIPVFTVLKNNCILKNIFLLDNPPSISSSSFSVAENADQEPEMEEILVVGRHPDCNIKLEHPSISRFHLRIHSKPSSRSLSVTDLSSVHGTWISGKRMEPGVRMKLNEGDTLHLGASSRLYRLNWVPLSCAYDINNPFVPQLESTADKVEEETEGPIDQDGDSLSYNNDQEQTLNDNVDGLELLFSDENLGSFCNNEEVENSSSPGIDNQENEEESSTPRARFPSVESRTASVIESMETSEMNSDKRSGLSIWSRRGKPESVQIETSRSRGNCGRINMSLPVESLVDENLKSESILEDHYHPVSDKNEKVFTPDKENMSPNSLLVRSLKTLISTVDQVEDEIFSPDKENMTPNSHLVRSMKNVSKLEEVKHRLSYNMIQEEAMISTLEKASQHQKVLQERNSTISASKSRGSLKKQSAVLNVNADRDPFRPVSVNSTIKNKASSKPLVHEEVNYSHNNTKRVENNRWIIVVDTGCLLNKKSRKELQLLRGLRGTTLVIPRIVVRELDCMLRRGSFFTRVTEVSAALQWIEESMAIAKWWIHIQSSAEEGRLIPSTPPASPHWFSDDKGPFSPYSLHEIVTPTAADHILECALFFKRTKNDDGQLVLLSDDVTMKIKAMAEGVICETAEEFRGSLVNPFSGRFLYSDSSPIGPTWSCMDDAVLKEKYYPSPSKKLSKSGERVKGLKLILLHNSNFRQIKPVS